MNCLIKMATGIICPSCGIFRAVLALLRGDLLEAAYYNPLVYIIPLFTIFLVFWKNKMKILVTFLIIVFILYIVRLLLWGLGFYNI